MTAKTSSLTVTQFLAILRLLVGYIIHSRQRSVQCVIF